MRLLSLPTGFWSAMLAAVATATAAPVGVPESILPAETLLAIHLRDTSNWDRELEGSLLHRAWDGPQGAPWREQVQKLLDENSAFDELGLTNREIWEQLPGSWVIAWRLPEEEKTEDPDDATPPLELLFNETEMFIMAQPADAEALRRIVEEADARILKEHSDRKIEQENHHGVTIYTDAWVADDGEAYIGSAYAITPEWFIFAEDPATVRDLLDAMAGRASSRRLNEVPGWADAEAELSGALVTVFGNGARVGALLDEAIRRIPPRSPMVRQTGLQPEVLAKLLRFDVFGGVYGGLVRDRDEWLLRTGASWQENVGVVSWIRVEPLARLPHFAPPGTFSSDVSGFDFGHLWRSIDAAFSQALPFYYNSFQTKLEDWRQGQGLDLREALFDNFGVGVFALSDLREDVTAAELLDQPLVQAVGIPLRQPENLLAFWRRLREALPSIEQIWVEREFNGHPVWDLVVPAGVPVPSMQLSTTVAHGHWMIGVHGSGLLDRVLAQSPGDPAIWDADELRPVLADMAPSTNGVSVFDLQRLGALLERILQAAIELSDASSDAEEASNAREMMGFFRGFSLDAWLVGTSEMRPLGIRAETRFVEKKP